MGVTTYPCPGCGQAQRQEHQNGIEIAPSLCPRCLEDFTAQVEEIDAGKGTSKEKLAKLSLLATRYRLTEDQARSVARAAHVEAEG
jgi:hypothetical protein